ncbi:hypothetical protein EDB89DRAFT_1903960 [Lactarius sanguifluus]|nr:hypothetical protein EDB89DRAFT_1903960 [Lactarius sanguifluus]
MGAGGLQEFGSQCSLLTALRVCVPRIKPTKLREKCSQPTMPTAWASRYWQTCEGHVRSRRQRRSSARATSVSGESDVSVIGMGRVSGSEGSRDALEKDELLVVNPGTTGYMWYVILGWYLWSTLVLMRSNVYYIAPGTRTDPEEALSRLLGWMAQW